ncbi:beta-N-acetylhexosaminidase [Niabella aurantiaca]|uniref:beta-N-acetylhexosaminidase n=1 Tax=Niabella aurantiaca TaxID=379900 RepID=UPI000377AA1E|nr:family 20 glycosylhydrolase [Niabella aurantiaca]
MNKLFPVIFLVLIATTARSQTSRFTNIIPYPASVVTGEGQFTVNSKTILIYDSEETKRIAGLYIEFLRQAKGFRLSAEKRTGGNPSLNSSNTIILNSQTERSEGYEMRIRPENILIKGNGAGTFYALQSLIQLSEFTGDQAIRIPAGTVKDQPRFGYRGMHLDVALHFFPVTFLKKFIDLMAQYKLNTFHWHLTEDQGWRLEIKKYPKLTREGAWRAQTLLGSAQNNPMGYDSIPHGGFYTREQVKELIRYAADRYVTIIPEIEMPGHCISALVAYPELACGDHPGPFKTIESWGIYEDVFCAGKESTFTFLENVLTEVMELFPSRYIHIGGDEVPKTRWKTCKYCQQRIKDQHLKDEHELQSYFIQRIEKFVNSRGRTIIGWDEILEGGLAPNAIVMSWRGEKGGIAAAQQHHQVIMAPNDYIYFDHYQAKPEQEPLGFPGLNDLNKVYQYNPASDALTAEQKKYVLGAEACVWTEYMATPAKVEYMILPRMLAFAEGCWTPVAQKQYEPFLEDRLPLHLWAIDKKNDTHFFVPMAIGAADNRVFQGKSFTVTLKPTVKDARIFYTLDDTDPRETDYLYEKPLILKVPDGEKRILKTIVITASGRRSAISRTTYISTRPSPLIPQRHLSE